MKLLERIRRRVVPGEQGIGMALIIGGGSVVMLLTLVAFSISGGSLTSSLGHSNFEKAVHLAEHGVDQTLARLQLDRDHKTPAEVPDIQSGLTTEQEADWVAENIGAAPTQSAIGGEYAILKPANRNVLFVVSWVPTRANPKRTRILKAEYVFSPYNPSKAFVAGGDLTISGNPSITGAGGHVHTNANMTVSGNPTIAGDLTASGTYSSSGNPDVGGVSGGGQPLETVPTIDSRDFYDTQSSTYSAAWHDLCTDGTIRRPGATPCTGTILADTSSGNAYYGWKISSDKWQNEPNQGLVDGVFYIYRRNAQLSANPGEPGAPWRATIITEGEPTPTASSCTQNYGDITMSGNPTIEGYITDTVLIAGRDLEISGNPSQNITGFASAREQIKISGNPNWTGAFVAEDRCNTSGSPVDENRISGNLELVFDADIEVPVDSLIRTTLWLEL